MTILQRYIIKELWLPLVLSFLTLNFIFMGGYLVKAANFIIGRGVPLLDTLYVLALALPQMVSYTIPTSILTAVMIVFGNFSQNNEIRAVKASGIHPLHVMLPAFALGLILSLMMFVFNDQVASNATFELRRTTKKMLIKHPMAMIEPGRFVNVSDTVVFLAKEVKGNEMFDIIAYENEGAGKPVRTIIAQRGEITSRDDHTKMQIRLYDGSISDSEDASVQSIQFETYEFPTLGQEDIRKMKKKMRDLTLAELLVESRGADKSVEDIRDIWSAFHDRIAFAFGSFIFVFLGIPIAILVHRGEIVLSFGIAMAAASIYYILFVGAKTFSVQGILPAVIAYWIPNVILVGLGVYLLKKAVAS
ncbi:MAG: LptF/LptG family permease [Candidatus Omnitrophica bacterium]|nr:LptF/LptG family permease [Candidatus Omnitrophota bacterium]